MTNKDLYGHWETTEHLDTEKYVGFVYIITNLVEQRKYIGSKKYKIKRKKDGEWKSYTGSCTELNNDIKKYGKDKFTFKVVKQYSRMVEVKYNEAKMIIEVDAIFRKDYYNQMVMLRMKGKK